MLTRRGWGVLAGAVGMLAAGRLLGLVELYMLAAGSVALCAASVAYVTLQSLDVRTERVLHPPRVHAGASSRVDLGIHNIGNRRTPVLEVRDPFDHGWRWARFLVPPLAARTGSRAAYRLPTEERGIFDIGPLEVSLADPFGLARRVSTSVGVTQLTVYPRIDVVSPLPVAQGHDPQSAARHPRALLGHGEDFYALRPYEVGDDLRRVHWASTARVDDLMIRQDEMPWQSRVTILLDVRHRVHTPESLELAVSAAASLHAAGLRARSLMRVVSTDGTDSGTAFGHAHSEAILEHLATVGATRQDRMAGVTGTLRRAGNGGVLAVVTTDRVLPADLEAVGRLRGRYSKVVLVLFERSAYDEGSGAARPSLLDEGSLPALSAVVRVTAGMPFAAAWERVTAAMQGARA